MKVILAGYSKTGTKTLAAAFTMLGFNTYDVFENYYYLHKQWMKIFHGEATSADIQKMFQGVDALTDSPVFYFWEDLCNAFPEAKVILTIRDEDAWYKSFLNHTEVFNKSYLMMLIDTFSIQSLISFVGVVLPWPSNYVKIHHEKLLRAHYRQHNQEVLEKVPPDKLLVYKVSDGWDPLCKFLGVDIPEQPFPHKNQRSSLIKDWTKSNYIYRNMLLQSIGSVFVLTLFTGYAGYNLFKYISSKRLLSGLTTWF